MSRWEINEPIDWWGKVVFLFLCLAIALLGVGGIKVPLLGLRFSAWSVSRMTFLFWLLWKCLVWRRYGRQELRWQKGLLPTPLLFFFSFVTISLLPDFREWGDYRYFFFAFLHYIMVVDVFNRKGRPMLLLCLLGIVPGFLFFRGVVVEPSVLNLSSMARFGYPLDHANTAGYIFSIGIPLSLAVIEGKTGWLRPLAGSSLGAQLLGLFFTYSRGAWLGWVVSMLFLGLTAKGIKKAWLILVLGLAILFTIPSLKSRLLNRADPLNYGPIHFRIQLIKDAFAVGMENPLLGVGYGRGRVKQAVRERRQGTADEKTRIWHAHNVYLDLFAGTGLLGLGAFLWLLSDALVKICRSAYTRQGKRSRFVHIGIASALIALIVTGLGDVPFYHHETRIFLFTLLALVHLHSREGPSSCTFSESV
ncbi:MAG: O-antigen ligase family protein [Candidatus Binatia bacterium]